MNGVELAVSNNKGFIKNNLPYMILAGIFCMLGMNVNALLIVGLLIFLVGIARSSTEHRFCWSLFLISNIRIFDNLGVTYIVNILMVLPLLYYFVWKITKEVPTVQKFPLIAGLALFLMVASYAVYYKEAVTPLIMWVMAFIWCSYVVLDSDVNVDKNDVIYALAAGVIFSALVYIIGNPEEMSDVISQLSHNYRFEAYANDPNYYSVYFCIAIAGIVIKDKISVSDYLLMLVLVCIGFLTASKMCMILMLVCIAYLIIGTTNAAGKYGRNILIFVGVCVLAYMNRELVSVFFENLFRRAGGEKTTLNTFTSGRFDIVQEYLNILRNDVSTLLVGKGFSYNTHFWGYLTKEAVAHNTYLDVIMSLGLVGGGIFIWIMAAWFKAYKKRCGANLGYTLTSKFPLAIMLLAFFALSCLDAGMFFFVVTACMLMLEPKKDNQDI